MIDVSEFSIKAISNRVKQSRSKKKPYINSISFKFLNLRINSSKKCLRVYMHYALQYNYTNRFSTNSLRDLQKAADASLKK